MLYLMEHTMEQTLNTAREDRHVATRIADMLQLLQDSLPIERRVVHTGDSIYRSGQPFKSLHIVNAGFFKLVSLSGAGHEQLVDLHFRGDWLGLDGIANGRHECEAIAMDTGEVWSIGYDALLEASTRAPGLLIALHEAMGRQVNRDHESILSLCTLPADARVAGFLRYWTAALAHRGLRTDQITLRMTRAEIGNYLGMTIETVSRAFSKLARGDVIRFNAGGRRSIAIPKVEALSAFIQGSAMTVTGNLQ
jgi:CRP/FNR family transcriptional regulator